MDGIQTPYTISGKNRTRVAQTGLNDTDYLSIALLSSSKKNQFFLERFWVERAFTRCTKEPRELFSADFWESVWHKSIALPRK